MLKYIQGVLMMVEQILTWYNWLTEGLLGSRILFAVGALLLLY